MALGLALMMGFRLPENFNNPYTALSITDFWRRWHISLGAWMRNYLYIPLGGNRVNTKWRLYFNLWLVFLASGLWHGAAWGFIIWGAYHGLFLVLERSILSRWLERRGRFAILYAFPVVVVGWVFFRFEHWAPSIAYLGRMFVPHFENNLSLTNISSEHYIVLSIGLFFAFVSLSAFGKKMCAAVFESSYSNRMHLSMFLISVILLTLSAGYILTSGFNPFIYFRF